MAKPPRRHVSISESLFDPGEPEDDCDAAEDEPGGAYADVIAKTRAKMSRRKNKPKTIAAAVFGRAVAEVEAMLQTGDWSGAGARHLVALYDRLHTKCYDVAPAELGPSERFHACIAAGNMIRREFEGDVVAAAEFMIWAWERELDREEWRRQNGRDGGRIGVRLMFGGALVTDYRLHLARRGRSA